MNDFNLAWETARKFVEHISSEIPENAKGRIKNPYSEPCFGFEGKIYSIKTGLLLENQKPSDKQVIIKND